MSRIDQIVRKIEQLKSLDLELRYHGSTGHKYAVQPVSHSDIEILEKKFQCLMPPQLISWLTEVGCRAGPGYGLLDNPKSGTGYGVTSFRDKIMAVLGRTKPPYDSNVIYTGGQVEDLGKLSQSNIDEYVTQLNSGSSFFEAGITSRTSANTLYLGAAGCTLAFSIILTGPFAGRIVEEDSEQAPDECYAKYRPEGIRRLIDGKWILNNNGMYEFLDWMEDWADRGLEYCKAGFKYPSVP